MPFKMHKLLFFFQKKKLAKMCVPTLPTFFYPFPETQLLFYLALASLDVY